MNKYIEGRVIVYPELAKKHRNTENASTALRLQCNREHAREISLADRSWGILYQIDTQNEESERERERVYVMTATYLVSCENSDRVDSRYSKRESVSSSMYDDMMWCTSDNVWSS
jgi:hypothetical protein